MKIYSKITLVVIMITVVIVAGFGVYSSQSGVRISDLMLENIEALANSSEDGTDVGYCFLKQSFKGSSGYKVFCDSKTSDTKIYPCETQSYDLYTELAQDRCTK